MGAVNLAHMCRSQPVPHLLSALVLTALDGLLDRRWPFWFGFAVTGTLITKVSLGLTGTCCSRVRAVRVPCQLPFVQRC